MKWLNDDRISIQSHKFLDKQQERRENHTNRIFGLALFQMRQSSSLNVLFAFEKYLFFNICISKMTKSVA